MCGLMSVARVYGVRQFRSVEQKRQMVQETLAPGASVAIIARRHGVNANQLFSWRRQYRRGVLELVNTPVSEESALVPIAVAPIDAPKAPRSQLADEAQNSGRIDIEFSSGRRVSVWDLGRPLRVAISKVR